MHLVVSGNEYAVGQHILLELSTRRYAGEREALVATDHVLHRLASEGRVLGTLCERADLAGLAGLAFARNCVAAGEV